MVELHYASDNGGTVQFEYQDYQQFVPYTVTGRLIEDDAAVGEGYIVSLSTTNESEYTTTNADGEFEITAYGP